MAAIQSEPGKLGALMIDFSPAKKYIRNVINKMQARSRTHAAIIVAQAGIVGNPVTTGISQAW